MRIYCDGSSNGYTSAICIHHQSIKKHHKIIVFNEFIKPFDIETIAVAEALKHIHELSNTAKKRTSSVILTDCINVVKAIYGESIENEQINDIRKLIAHNDKKSIIISWIPRDINLAGVCLAKRIKTLRKHGFIGKNLNTEGLI